jgi:hypothetical protein
MHNDMENGSEYHCAEFVVFLSPCKQLPASSWSRISLKRWFPQCTAQGFATNSQGFRGYISLIASLKFTYFIIEGILFC